MFLPIEIKDLWCDVAKENLLKDALRKVVDIESWQE